MIVGDKVVDYGYYRQRLRDCFHAREELCTGRMVEKGVGDMVYRKRRQATTKRIASQRFDFVLWLK